MLIETTAHLPFGFAMFQELIHGPGNVEGFVKGLLRWSHFVAGITWVGILYFFNLVNVPLMKALDGPTKSKVIPEMMPRALWYFRWGAMFTVLAGLTYYAMYIVSGDAHNAEVNPWIVLGKWLGIVLVAYAIIYATYNVSALTKDGRVLAVVISIIVIAMMAAIVYVLSNTGDAKAGKFLGNKTISIGCGGGLGIIMFLNVWGIIWRAQKVIIAGVLSGNPAPAELARKAFLASRTNAWLSLPMLFFMGTSHGDWILFGK